MNNSTIIQHLSINFLPVHLSVHRLYILLVKWRWRYFILFINVTIDSWYKQLLKSRGRSVCVRACFFFLLVRSNMFIEKKQWIQYNWNEPGKIIYTCKFIISKSLTSLLGLLNWFKYLSGVILFIHAVSYSKCICICNINCH